MKLDRKKYNFTLNAVNKNSGKFLFYNDRFLSTPEDAKRLCTAIAMTHPEHLVTLESSDGRFENNNGTPNLAVFYMRAGDHGAPRRARARGPRARWPHR